MSHENKIIIPRESVVWVVPETVAGTLVFPAAGDGVVLAGDMELGQTPSYTDSPEIADTRSKLGQAQDVTPSGTWRFPTLCRPSGSKGVAPAEGPLLEAHFGKETVNAGTSVVYSCEKELPSVSIWVKEGNVVRFARGATVDEFSVRSGAAGFVGFEWGGGFMELGVCAEDELAEAISSTPDTSVLVANSYKFTAGAKVKVGTDDNSGAGYLITAVDHVTGTLTVTPGVGTAQLLGAAVVPHMPAHTPVGTAVAARTGTVTVGGASKAYSEFELRSSQGLAYVEDEVTTAGYPSDYAEGDRTIDGSYLAVYRTDEAVLFRKNLAGQTPAVAFAAGGAPASGSAVAFAMPKARLQVPTVQNDRPAKKLRIGYTALFNAAYEDEITVTYS